MPVIALADFGSTFTKVSLVDNESGQLLGRSQHPTTVETDVMEGFAEAKRAALRQASLGCIDYTLAASSAAGGLRMVAVGLVDALTAAAAHRSALGAGAKVSGVHSGSLSAADVQAIRDENPDVILFAGGTDGGERDRVVANAQVVAAARTDAAVVVACNRDVASKVARIFAKEGHETTVVANVLPHIQRENSQPAREAIRGLFIRRVVHAKGLSNAKAFFDALLMPTPAAVLACAELIARGAESVPGRGSAVIVDVGGATTDVHSVVQPPPSHARVQHAGPMPALSMRTVEGDLGVRWSAESVLELDHAWLIRRLALSRDRVQRAVSERRRNPALVAQDDAELQIDRSLTASCICLAVGRHVGRVATRYVPGEGAEVAVDGRDLREAVVVLATGGSLAHDPGCAPDTVRTALLRLRNDQPAPRSAQVVIDVGYIAAAAGLLASVNPVAAIGLLRDQAPDLGLE